MAVGLPRNVGAGCVSGCRVRSDAPARSTLPCFRTILAAWAPPRQRPRGWPLSPPSRPSWHRQPRGRQARPPGTAVHAGPAPRPACCFASTRRAVGLQPTIPLPSAGCGGAAVAAAAAVERASAAMRTPRGSCCFRCSTARWRAAVRAAAAADSVAEAAAARRLARGSGRASGNAIAASPRTGRIVWPVSSATAPATWPKSEVRAAFDTGRVVERDKKVNLRAQPARVDAGQAALWGLAGADRCWGGAVGRGRWNGVPRAAPGTWRARLPGMARAPPTRQCLGRQGVGRAQKEAWRAKGQQRGAWRRGSTPCQSVARWEGCMGETQGGGG